MLMHEYVLTHTCGLADGESQADGGVADAHAGGHNGHKGELVQIRNLAEQDLDGPKDDAVAPDVGLVRGSGVAMEHI